MKIWPFGAELFHAGERADRQTEMTKLVVSFRNFAKASDVMWIYNFVFVEFLKFVVACLFIEVISKSLKNCNVEESISGNHSCRLEFSYFPLDISTACMLVPIKISLMKFQFVVTH